MADMLDKTINSIITALIAVVLIASAFIPIVISQVDALTKYAAGIKADVSMYTSLITVVVVMTIIGIIIGVIRTYQQGGSGDGKR